MTNSGHTVLIVEDDASMRRAMERLLGTTGFVVLGYVSAEAVLAAGLPDNIACVISDLKLPGISGLELLAELRARGFEAPLILITAYDVPGRCAEALRRGAAAYLVKPFHGLALLDALRAVIERDETP
jgi:FixJ family two-component response regulator